MPRVARGEDFDIIEKSLEKIGNSIDGIIADNLYAIYLGKKYGKKIIGGIGLNIFNNSYSKILGLNGVINSVELNKSELVNGGIIYGYGKLPIMTLLHCPVQVNTKCDCNTCKYKGDFSYFDKRGEYQISRNKIRYCQFELYNQQIIDVRNKISSLNAVFYLNLRNCNKVEIVKIIEDFVKKCDTSVDNSTCGHLFRGVK
ncbi:MAG: hypothetical protein K2K24_01505 [Clostridia bacterium]|nr:hypothetical protein [Clostridia bacterium]